MSHRAQEDLRKTELLHQARTDSATVYGYRKLADDQRDQGERVAVVAQFPDGLARLETLASRPAPVHLQE